MVHIPKCFHHIVVQTSPLNNLLVMAFKTIPTFYLNILCACFPPFHIGVCIEHVQSSQSVSNTNCLNCPCRVRCESVYISSRVLVSKGCAHMLIVACPISVHIISKHVRAVTAVTSWNSVTTIYVTLYSYWGSHRIKKKKSLKFQIN